MSDRYLNESEIESLIEKGCKSDNWRSIQVAEKFDTENIENVHFSGEINLGVFKDSCEVEKNVLKPSGLYNCFLKNVSIQNNVRVADVGFVQNYIIEEGACVDNTKSLIIAGETTPVQIGALLVHALQPRQLGGGNRAGVAAEGDDL